MGLLGAFGKGFLAGLLGVDGGSSLREMEIYT
jgi:hypothetical protein